MSEVNADARFEFFVQQSPTSAKGCCACTLLVRVAPTVPLPLTEFEQGSASTGPSTRSNSRPTISLPAWAFCVTNEPWANEPAERRRRKLALQISPGFERAPLLSGLYVLDHELEERHVAA